MVKHLKAETARYTLPDIVDPGEYRCFTIRVPKEKFHLAAFRGQLLELASARAWGNDTFHTALAVAAVWRRLLDEVTEFDCDLPPGSFTPMGVEGAEDNLIRQNPDNPCLLETSINGTDWCPFADLSLCTPAGSQPGSGSSQPSPGGGDQCYNARLQASNKWLLPFQVNTGDVIAISDTTGAWTDGSGLWQCPNGQSYFLGACTGTTALNGADPAPTIPHASLIAKIGSVYYAAYNTSITVPAGITAANVEFQINDASLSGNYGEVSFKACVTNNAATTWEQVFDFTQSDHGWLATHPQANTNAAVWAAGLGWQAACVHGDSDANNYQEDNINKVANANTTLSYVEVHFNRAATGVGATSLSDAIQITGVNLFLRTSGYPTGNDLLMTWVGTQALNSGQLIQANVAQAFGAVGSTTCPIVATPALIKRITVRGTGTNPFV